MPDAKRGDVSPTRDPVGHGRAATEGGILTMLGVVIAWGVSLLPAEVPTAVQTAIVGLVVALGTLAFSEWRNRAHDLKTLGKGAVSGIALPFSRLGPLFVFLIFTPAAVLVVSVSSCVSWDGPEYKRLAGDEIARLVATSDSAPLDVSSCEALAAGTAALRDEEGGSKSMNAPFLAGQHIDEAAAVQERIALRCFELAEREAERGVTPAHRIRLRAAWVRTWRNGRALQGGPDGEE